MHIGALWIVGTPLSTKWFCFGTYCIRIILIPLTCASARDLFYPIKPTTQFGMENIYTKWNIAHSSNRSNEQRSEQNGTKTLAIAVEWEEKKENSNLWVCRNLLMASHSMFVVCSHSIYSDADIHTLEPPPPPQQHQLRKFIKCYWQWHGDLAFS